MIQDQFGISDQRVIKASLNQILCLVQMKHHTKWTLVV